MSQDGNRFIALPDTPHVHTTCTCAHTETHSNRPISKSTAEGLPVLQGHFMYRHVNVTMLKEEALMMKFMCTDMSI